MTAHAGQMHHVPETDIAAVGESAFCLLCGGGDHDAVFNEFGVDVLRCRRCRHMFSSYVGDPHYDGFWGEDVPEGDQFYWCEARARMHQDFSDRILKGRSGRLLDMGCGLGYFLKVIERHAGWEGYGCEVAETAVRYAHQKLGLANVLQTHLEEASFEPASFDVITMWDVIDHLLRPDPVLRRCNELLKEGGVFFVRTPNAPLQLFRARLTRLLRGMNPQLAYLQARDHMHLYSAGSIRRLLERNGFEQIEFVHLHPIEGVSRRGHAVVRGVKNTCFAAVRALAWMSGERWNLDNLFVVCRKASNTAYSVARRHEPVTAGAPVG